MSGSTCSVTVEEGLRIRFSGDHVDAFLANITKTTLILLLSVVEITTRSGAVPVLIFNFVFAAILVRPVDQTISDIRLDVNL